MSVLSYQSIVEKVESGEIRVIPEPDEDQFQPASFDIRLGRNIYNYTEDREYTEQNAVRLRPGGRYLGHTKSAISLPNNIAAQVSGRSSLGRDFVTIHQTAGWIDPGYSGQITLEIANFSHEVQRLPIGSRVGQIVFFELDESTEESYGGQYQHDTGPIQSGDL